MVTKAQARIWARGASGRKVTSDRRNVLQYHGICVSQASRAFRNSTAASAGSGGGLNDDIKTPGDGAVVGSAGRDFFLSVLGSSATKRDAKSYLSRFQRPTKHPKLSPSTLTSDKRERISEQASHDADKTGVNLGSFYRARAIDDTPVFVQQAASPELLQHAQHPLRVALVKLRAPQLLPEEILEGIGITLTQLGRLGLNCVLVVDCGTDRPPDEAGLAWRSVLVQQAERVAKAIQKNNPTGARCVDCAVGLAPVKDEATSAVKVHDDVQILYPDLIFRPLRRGIIPVIPPISYRVDDQKVAEVKPDAVVLALTREFAGLSGISKRVEGPREWFDTDPVKVHRPQDVASVERILVLDPLGAIPASDRPNGTHIFINMEQEYDQIREELIYGLPSTPYRTPSTFAETDYPNGSSSFTKSDPQASDGLHRQTRSISPSTTNPPSGIFSRPLHVRERHLKNLTLLQQALALLPSSSSAFVTTPQEASNSALSSASRNGELGVETRRQKNPLIHNLLTDKPAVSSSLPDARLRPADPSVSASATDVSSQGTFIKRGMPLTIIPDPRSDSWRNFQTSRPQLSLHDPRIDLPRTVHLIEDSFGRRLDVEHYLNRIKGTTAGIIIAGEYEGGAILTWEMPSGSTKKAGSSDSARAVPYLDKFAALKRSQGAGGVADIVFNAMVRSCFPDGVCWRSRKSNPVNKWYFERAEGTWKLPGSNWTMFWTTKDLVKDKQKWLDYVDVCRNIKPSWADSKNVVD